MKIFLCLFFFSVILAPCIFLHAEKGENSKVQFDWDVLPILAENCFECHGPDKAVRKADLRLDSDTGDKDWSAFLKRIGSLDPEEVMPPPKTGKHLSVEEINSLKKWIESGARYERHWAFRPIRQHKPPSIAGNELTEIDRFIVDRLSTKGLELSKPISRQRLIRRATFDLTGLPPSWSEVEVFVNDMDSDEMAFAKVVDRLLESPAYGERWGRHWLDLARYADTHGGSAIGFKRFPFSYTYRDYVIRSFNEDKAYDQFILEQLAADQLKLKENDTSLAALGFLTVGRQYRNRHDRLDDRIDVISRGMLGLTVTCARCHDHKFDPIPTSDYYSLHATLANSRVPNELPLLGKPEISEKFVRDLSGLKQKSADVLREQGDVFRGRLRMQVGEYLEELAKGTPEKDTSTSFLSYRTEDLRPVVLERWRKYLKARGDDDPVFGPWLHLSNLETDGFADKSRQLVAKWTKENGDPAKFANEHSFGTKPPKWNPRVLEALNAGKSDTFVDVATAYGKVFTEVQRRWLASLLEASLEAAPGGKVIPDQDARHKIVNSSIERQLRHHLHAPGTPTAITFENRRELGMLNRGVRDATRGIAQGDIESLNLASNSPPRSMILQESLETDPAFVFLRGNPVSRGEAVEPRFLSALSVDSPKRFVDGERRLGLARAIIDSRNPLTRRVIVNWVWRHHFGRGLVRTPDDFGTRGTPPTHPELLDYLALQFEADGWSIKQLHRRLMMTAAYRQDSREKAQARTVDPENSLLWRMPLRKLEMEAMRDALLAASGELKLTPRGGRPFELDKGVKRRSVYAFVNRDVIHKLFSTFDGADPSACTVKRPRTMVPQQTLFALNSAFIQDRAAALLKVPEIQKAPDDKERINRLYRRTFSRQPSPEEIIEATSYINKSKNKEEARRNLVHALLASNEFHFVD